MKLDKRDVIFMAGLALFAAGLSWAWPPLGLIGAGIVLMAAAAAGAIRT